MSNDTENQYSKMSSYDNGNDSNNYHGSTSSEEESDFESDQKGQRLD